MGEVGQEVEAKKAITTMVEGQQRCAVTGDAFELLLQLPDQSVLEAVMQNVVVFARMKPHQKGQVMSLLNTRGIYQMHAGKQRHIQVHTPTWTTSVTHTYMDHLCHDITADGTAILV